MKKGLNENQIQEQLDALPETQASRVGESISVPEVKQWPPEKQVVLDWRMPADAIRVMLFERLEY